MQPWQNYISSDPKIMLGKPCIRGTRIPVDLILERLGAGETIEQLLEAYPHLTVESIHAALLFASTVVKSETVYPLPS